MKKKLLNVLGVLLLMSHYCVAQYNAAQIPDALIKNASVVKRLYEIKVDIVNPGRAKVYYHSVYTILDEAGDEYADYVSFYDKLTDLSNISGALYDAAGKKLRSVKKKDIEDLSGNSGAHLAIDNRIKHHNFYYKSYPYTVEYEEENDYNGILQLPEFKPASDHDVSVENSRLIVIAPKDYALRYKQINYTGSPSVKEEKSTRIYTWELKNIAAKEEETFSPDWDEMASRILIAPSEFEIEGYKGNMNSWQNFGKFMTTLYGGRDVLPADIKAKVHQLTDKLGTDKEKITALYKFMQDNTHYISIQLGIGSWQPLYAGYVAQKKYGDCKALSNYMVALLKEAGIKAHNVLIRAGKDDKDIIADFPSNQFNHVIVCVPGKPARPGGGKDTTWLECTSQTLPAGYLGDFTGNREALLVDDAKSTIVQTPEYSKTQNLQNRLIEGSVDANGKLTAKVITVTTGLQQDDLHTVIHNTSREDQQKRLQQILSLSNYDVRTFAYTENNKNDVPSITESIDLVSADYASITGKRLFIRPNILSMYISKLDNSEKRENDIALRYAFIDTDTVTIQLPGGYKIEAMPKEIDMKNKFGSCHIFYHYSNAKVQMVRVYERTSGVFPAGEYKNFADFMNTVYKADNAKMVFVKEDE